MKNIDKISVGGSSGDLAAQRENQQVHNQRLRKYGQILRKLLVASGEATAMLSSARRTVLRQALQIGRILCLIKSRIGHGTWLNWLSEHTTVDGRQLITDRVARNYMAISRNRKLFKMEMNADLTITESLDLIRRNRTQAKGLSSDQVVASSPLDPTPEAVQGTPDDCTAEPGPSNQLSALPKLKTVGMYSASVQQWNPYAGCDFHCSYCEKSFQRILKRQKHNCPECYSYEPHSHPSRIDANLRATGPFEFIFTCSHGDISFCDDAYFGKILARIKNEPDKNFLLQSKSPKKAFERAGVKLPRNVLIGTTIETNRAELCRKFTNAPPPELRYRQLRDIDHPYKQVTIEPIMAFDLEVIVQWVREINPRLVWLGYDSKNCGLEEPTLEEFITLTWRLAELGVAVIVKKSFPGKGPKPE